MCFVEYEMREDILSEVGSVGGDFPEMPDRYAGIVSTSLKVLGSLVVSKFGILSQAVTSVWVQLPQVTS